MKPLILINFKTYPETVGNKALELAKRIAQVNSDKYELAVAPTVLTTKEIAQKKKLTVFSQHTDHQGLGAHTSSILADELKLIGVKGTLLNHSERKIHFSDLKKTVQLCKDKKLKVVVCASTIFEIKKVAQLHPDYIAYEPKELIGGNISVTESKPELIVRAVEVVKYLSPKTKLLCGAGIHSKEDLGHALLLGAEGVLIGHAVAKAKDAKKFLEEMLI